MNACPTAPVAPSTATRWRRARGPEVVVMWRAASSRFFDTHPRRSPSAEQRNVRRICNRRHLESRDGLEVLRGDVRTVLDFGATVRPLIDFRSNFRDIADESKHDFGLGERR